MVGEKLEITITIFNITVASLLCQRWRVIQISLCLIKRRYYLNNIKHSLICTKCPMLLRFMYLSILFKTTLLTRVMASFKLRSCFRKIDLSLTPAISPWKQIDSSYCIFRIRLGLLDPML